MLDTKIIKEKISLLVDLYNRVKDNLPDGFSAEYVCGENAHFKIDLHEIHADLMDPDHLLFAINNSKPWMLYLNDIYRKLKKYDRS